MGSARLPGTRGAPICHPETALGSAADQAFQGFAVAAAQYRLQRVERVAEALRLLQHLLAVGQQDVAPDLGAAGGDAREVAEARARQRQEIVAAGLMHDGAEVGIGQQVRQVADGGERGVVPLCGHAQHLRTHGVPGPAGALDELRRVLRQRRQDHLAALVERGVGVLDARGLLARDRVRRHELRHAFTQRAPCRIDDVALGAAHVHHQHAWAHQLRDRSQCALGGRDRHCQQHQVGTGNGEQRRLGGVVDDAHAPRQLGGRGALAVADDALDQARALERERERAAHQATADQAELLEHPGLISRRPGRCRAP